MDCINKYFLMKINKPSFWNSKNFISIILLPISLIVNLITIIKK